MLKMNKPISCYVQVSTYHVFWQTFQCLPSVLIVLIAYICAQSVCQFYKILSLPEYFSKVVKSQILIDTTVYTLSKFYLILPKHSPREHKKFVAYDK